MIRIGILGSPDSGKSDLAERLAEQLKPKSSYVIDNYVEEVSKEAVLAIFPFSPYIANLAIAMKRFAKENRHTDYDYQITCGTILDTQLYEAIEGHDSDRFKPYEDHHKLRAEAAIQVLGCLFLDSFLYDVAFLNMYEGESEDWTAFSVQLKNILEIYDIEYVELAGDPDKRLLDALTAIKEAQKEYEAKNADGRRIPGSRTKGSEDGDTPQPVPNVPVPEGSD